jgi:transitional endoplasmic reticulum ATPase
MPEQTKELSKETCPYCNKQIEVPYGYDIPCPECGGKINVFDPEKRRFDVSRGYRARSLTDDHQPSQTHFHEGRAGSSLSRTGVSYEDIGGLEETIEELDILINGPSKYPDLWKSLGGKQPRGVLLTGPSGCGKTLLIQAISASSGRKMVLVQGAEIKGWRVGDSENNLIRAYESARPNGIFVIDEIDAIGGKRDQMINSTEASIVATLCSLLDGARHKDNVIVMATTNRPYALDSALRRPGRFDLEIEILPPNLEGRKKIFRIHTKGMNLSEDIDLDALAKQAHGFTGADIAGACSAVSQRILKNCAQKLKQGTPEKEVARMSAACQQDFLEVVRATTPSLLRGFSGKVSQARWEDVGGLSEVKEELQRIVIWPVEHRGLMEKLQMRLPKGMLLHGPPGCGKTLLARAVAGEIDYNFLTVNGPSLLSKWVGDSEGGIRELFWRARMARPCIIFIDEMDGLASARGQNTDSGVTDRTVSQLLTEMDGVLTLQDVFVIGATNRKDMIDPALLRPGRLDLAYEIPLPDKNSRKQIFEIHLRGVPSGEIDVDALSHLTEGRSGADIEWICTLAKKTAAERCIEAGDSEEKAQIVQNDLLQALKELKESRQEKRKAGFTPDI